MTRTGLLGGSFNPAHQGHRRITLEAIAGLGLDEAWWLVSPGNPLKDGSGMAPFAARLACARSVARRAPILVTGIERELGTRYTVDTLRRLVRRYPRRRFVWLMGADNLAEFHRWKEWRAISRIVTIAVVTRPGYHGRALKAPAMGWLRRFVRPAAEARHWTKWRLPSLVLLDLPPDPTSATALRAARGQWHEAVMKSFHPEAMRDPVTRRPLSGRRPFARNRTRSAD
ncbi:MAG TPA: nicotinate-nucleotide adenylyltransferase [Allosphingosinicella sp.]|nr:nicotinate-nucleotide adenylyltransferase [Allosphingosinicella sp.]